VLNLVKTYDNGKKAVHGISLDLYKGQIFVLLGHNGAGKTTTISMLTGLLEATSGSFSAFGHENMDMIRTFMGVCPQYNTLFDTLTVKEHLEMFARFKGMNENTIETASKAMIVQLDLEEKTDYLSKDLSGGQKRRLLVGMAFIGDSKLVFLDEPTSGMDTSARRYVWTLLKNLKQDRIIILTTHFMDEADYLGDRIGIMSAGKLVCCGSPGWLKNRYGEGYTLTIIKAVTTSYQPELDHAIITHHRSRRESLTRGQDPLERLRRTPVPASHGPRSRVPITLHANREIRISDSGLRVNYELLIVGSRSQRSKRSS
jgi:ATP-binding cassette subfamily A (ABC1) protein 3